MIPQARWEPGGPCHILSLPPASASVQGLLEPGEAAQEAALHLLARQLGLCASLTVAVGPLPCTSLACSMSLQTPQRGCSCTLTLLTPVPLGTHGEMAELTFYSGDGPLSSPARSSPPADHQEIGKLSSHTGCSSAPSVFEPENHFEDGTFGFKGKRENFKQSPG